MTRCVAFGVTAYLFCAGCGGDAGPEDDMTQVDMVRIEGGSFQMGDAGQWVGTSEHPVHHVTVSSFSISR